MVLSGPISLARESRPTASPHGATRRTGSSGGTAARLDAEEIRDAMLAAAGTLDRSRPAGVAGQGSEGDRDARTTAPRPADSTTRRTASRAPQRLPAAASRRDAARARGRSISSSRAGHRQPRHDHGCQQALYLLNDPFVRQQSLALAERLLEADARRRRTHRRGLPADARPGADATRRWSGREAYLAEYEAANYREPSAAADGEDSRLSRSF